MNVAPVLILCSLMLAAAGVALFVYSIRQRDHEHADRLSLLPLSDDQPAHPTVSDSVKEDSDTAC